MSTQNLSNLFNRYLQNDCNAQEIVALLDYFELEKHTSELKLLIEQQLLVIDNEKFYKHPAVNQTFEKSDLYLQNMLFPKKRNFVFQLYPYIRYAVAVSIVVMLAVTVYLFNQSSVKMPKALETANLVNDALPGTNEAILTLADGSSVILGDDSNSTISKDSGIKISKTKDGVLTYEVTPKETLSTDKLIYNQLHTPNGAKYEILLPDGTKVWLNASSTLRYPVTFAANERRVELTGEAYFEVQKVTKNQTRIPFYVETSGQEIQVLGTEFNVSAYPDELLTKTTLVSGRVNVRGGLGNNLAILTPGEQATSNLTIPIEVSKVNVENAIAWKNGNFMFEDVDLEEILKQLSRWYKVDVDLNRVPKTRYNMLISRNETLKSVINMLERTGNIKFQILNNTIRIIN